MDNPATNETDEKVLTKQQLKSRKKRQAAKQKKSLEKSQQQHQNDLDNRSNDLDNRSNDLDNRSNHNGDKLLPVVQNDDHMDNFEQELCWCVHQLEIGLKSEKPTKEHTKKTTHLLNQLKSSKTPKPKKRMLMKMNFGNYREKMAKEEKAYQQVKPSIKLVDDQAMKKSVFLKKKISDLPSVSSEPNADGFLFNFPAPT